MGADYIPEQDRDAAVWMRWFARALVNDPVAYGTTAEKAARVQAAALAYSAAAWAAMPSAFRCKARVCEKNVTRLEAERLIRPEAQRVRTDPEISTLLKVKIGLRPRRKRRRHVGPPASMPVLTVAETKPGLIVLRVSDSVTGRRARPKDAAGMELYARIRPHAEVEAANRAIAANATAAVAEELAKVGAGGRPAGWQYLGVVTTEPITVEPPVRNRGDEVTLVGRWITRRGEGGPFGLAVIAYLAPSEAANLGHRPRVRRGRA